MVGARSARMEASWRLAYRVRGIKIGNVSDFEWPEMRAQIALEMSLRIGDYIQIVGPDTDFRQTVREMEFRRTKVKRGKPAQKVWIPVEAHVRPGDAVVIMPSPDAPEA